MPRPTVRKWCEHGYTTAFQLALSQLPDRFTTSGEIKPLTKATESNVDEKILSEDKIFHEKVSMKTVEKVNINEKVNDNINEKITNNEINNTNIRATIPVTLDDTEIDLIVLDGQDPEEAVVEFCRKHLADDIPGCIAQLLTTVIDKLNEESS